MWEIPPPCRISYSVVRKRWFTHNAIGHCFIEISWSVGVATFFEIALERFEALLAQKRGSQTAAEQYPRAQIGCYKQMISAALRTRTLELQKTETKIALNRITRLGTAAFEPLS
ncbi:MAG: hypothetical protein AAGI34_11020 [Pseudomonadota bacterium]